MSVKIVSNWRGEEGIRILPGGYEGSPYEGKRRDRSEWHRQCMTQNAGKNITLCHVFT